jgi:hypothetical protein
MLWAIYCVDKADTAALCDRHMRPHRTDAQISGR